LKRARSRKLLAELRWIHRGSTTVRLSRSVRRMVAGTALLATWAEALTGLAAAEIAHRILHLPGPGWGIRPSHHVLTLISSSIGVVAALGVFPLWRMSVGGWWRRRAADVDALAARLAGKISGLIDEERRGRS
jgi:hypothetical protein